MRFLTSTLNTQIYNGLIGSLSFKCLYFFTNVQTAAVLQQTYSETEEVPYYTEETIKTVLQKFPRKSDT